MTTMESSPRPRRDATSFVWHLDTRAGLAAMFLLALLVRLAFAQGTGFYADLNVFRSWAVRLDEVGPDRFYIGNWADYPPGYLYVLWVIGKVSSPPGYTLLKLPAILGDLALAWIAGAFAQTTAPASLRERVPVRALVAAAVLFNPAVILLSAVWGQVDVVPAVFVLWSLFVLLKARDSWRRELAAFLSIAIAISIKPQACFVLPVMLYTLYRRYLRRRPRAEMVGGALRIAMLSGVSVSLWLLLALPFGLAPIELIRFYRRSASLYPLTSVNAFNLWGAIGFVRPDSGRDLVAVAGIPAVYFGILLFTVGAAIVLWRTHRGLERGFDEARVLLVGAAGVSLLAFALLTRMHERYMFYSLAYLAPLVLTRPLRLAFVALSGLFFMNLWWVYAYAKLGSAHGGPCSLPFPGCLGFDEIFGGFGGDTWQKKLWSIAFTVIALTVAWFGARWATCRQAPAGQRRV